MGESMRMWMFQNNASVPRQCGKTSELVLAQSPMLWRFYLWMFSVCVCVFVHVEFSRCVHEWRKHANMLLQYAKKSMQGEWESLFAKFASLTCRNATMPSECTSWLCNYIHPLSLVTQVMNTCVSFSKHFWVIFIHHLACFRLCHVID